MRAPRARETGPVGPGNILPQVSRGCKKIHTSGKLICGAEDGERMGECLLTHKALDFTPQHRISQLWWYSPVILAIWEMEAGKEKFKVVVGQPGLHETILGESQMI